MISAYSFMNKAQTNLVIGGLNGLLLAGVICLFYSKFNTVYFISDVQVKF